MSELTNLPNIAAEMEKQLNAVGIMTVEQLKETGSREAWLRILATDPSACYNRLCGLEGAIQGVRWHNLPIDVKKELKEFYKEAKSKWKLI
jgi:DNA transformation protein